MSLIKKINLEKTVDYSQNNLEYFNCCDHASNLSDYQQLTNKIRLAKESVKIATTDGIANEVYDALHSNSNLNVYVVFKSFDKEASSLSKFDSKKPIIAREVKELDNNFIIIDDISYLLINPLSQKENLFLEFDEKKTEDLNFIFNYLFWNCSTLEKLVDKVSQPIESPFPPFDNRKLQSINLINENINNIETIYIPRDKRFSDDLNNEFAVKYFSDDIKAPIYLTHEFTQIGRLCIKNMRFAIKNHWELKSNILADIPTNFEVIPREDSWFKTIKVTDSKTVKLQDIRAETIDAMKETKPVSFPEENYVNSICFNWDVLPPIKATNAKMSPLYREYSDLSREFAQQLSLLENKLNDLHKESSILSSLLGVKTKTTNDLKRIAEYKERKLEEEKPIELRELFTKEFKDFFKGVIDSEKSFKNNKQKQEAEQRWEKAKKDKIIELNKKQKEIETINESLKNDNNTKQQDKLKSLEKSLSKLNQDISNNYTKFVFEPKKNEMVHLSKGNTLKYKEFKIPAFALPEVGILYESNDSYYLEIHDYEHLDKAKELEQRYNNKNYKVVAGESDE